MMMPGLLSPRLLAALALLLAVGLICAYGQQPAADATSAAAAPANSAPVEPVDKRILGVLPNYRTVQDTGGVEPIPSRKKLWIASKDTFDYPIWVLAAGFAGLYQLENENPSFGQGAKGYFKRYGTSLADQMMGNLLTEGVFPVLLHEDPRYFRRGRGGTWHRAGYAVTRIFVTRTDSGSNRFNFSELIGNSIAVGVSNAYYPDDRDIGDNLHKLGLQLGTDAFSNVLKEFWPDIRRKFHHRQPGPAAAATSF
jgi:hypothetical protein